MYAYAGLGDINDNKFIRIQTRYYYFGDQPLFPNQQPANNELQEFSPFVSGLGDAQSIFGSFGSSAKPLLQIATDAEWNKIQQDVNKAIAVQHAVNLNKPLPKEIADDIKKRNESNPDKPKEASIFEPLFQMYKDHPVMMIGGTLLLILLSKRL